MCFFQKKYTELTNKLFIKSRPEYTPKNSNYLLYYKKPFVNIFRRGVLGIVLSLILSSSVILSIIYLLKIIKNQKELALIKNDLISNITHEFKTPIATVTTAIEAMENFNVINDKEKTKKYLNVSSFQLKKLHQMVEKLLETATLDSEQLLLKKENTDIVIITEKTVNKFKLLASDKEIVFTTNLKPI